MRAAWFGGLAAAIAVTVGSILPSAPLRGAPLPVELASNRVLRAVVNSDLKILDTTWTTTYITIRYGYLVYDTLFALDSKFQPKPQMVDTTTISPDNMTYTFTLRAGQTWSDGASVTAADCAASLTRWSKRNSMGQNLVAAMDGGFEALDDRTLRIKLKRPFGLVLDALAGG